MSNAKLSHIDSDGRAFMVDVSEKPDTKRIAIAVGRVLMSESALEAALNESGPKGNVITTAEIAGIMAAKKTSDLIPMCHPLPISNAKVTVEPVKDVCALEVVAKVTTTGKTGVEMEALTAVSVACLTLYDMLKALEKSMRIEGVRLLEKSGGVKGDYKADME